MMYKPVPYPCTRGTYTPMGWHNYVYQSGKIFCSFCGSIAEQSHDRFKDSSHEQGNGMRESLDRGIAEASRGQTESLGDFAQYSQYLKEEDGNEH